MAPTSSSSDDESDYCETEESLSVKVNKIINECKNMEPNICDLNFPKLRSSLLKCKTVETKELNLRSSSRDDRKKVSDSFRELSSDITIFQKKLDSILDCVLSVLDNMEHFETRIGALEKKVADRIGSSSYAEVASNNSNLKDTSDRINKLEFKNSEEERKKRLLQISIKHPLIDPNSNNLHDDIAKFLAENMKITNREMDTSLIVQKTSRPNTVILTFSDRRFKLFIFKACKNLRTANDEVSSKPLSE